VCHFFLSFLRRKHILPSFKIVSNICGYMLHESVQPVNVYVCICVHMCTYRCICLCIYTYLSDQRYLGVTFLPDQRYLGVMFFFVPTDLERFVFDLFN
jgi:hypothetical protein